MTEFGESHHLNLESEPEMLEKLMNEFRQGRYASFGVRHEGALAD